MKIKIPFFRVSAELMLERVSNQAHRVINALSENDKEGINQQLKSALRRSSDGKVTLYVQVLPEKLKGEAEKILDTVKQKFSSEFDINTHSTLDKSQEEAVFSEAFEQLSKEVVLNSDDQGPLPFSDDATAESGLLIHLELDEKYFKGLQSRVLKGKRQAVEEIIFFCKRINNYSGDFINDIRQFLDPIYAELKGLDQKKLFTKQLLANQQWFWGDVGDMPERLWENYFFPKLKDNNAQADDQSEVKVKDNNAQADARSKVKLNVKVNYADFLAFLSEEFQYPAVERKQSPFDGAFSELKAAGFFIRWFLFEKGFPLLKNLSLVHGDQQKLALTFAEYLEAVWLNINNCT